jgi:Flp pilus assembly protein TadG
VRDLILRPAGAFLARRLTALRDDGGRGAIGVLVAVLIGSGVLFGMAALVVDVGQIYQNRAELQNGADAAALAVAKSCAAGTCTPSTATTYAAANASKLTGGKACVNFVSGVNGTVPVSWVPAAGTCAAAKKVCPPNPPAGANYVDVETSTLLPNGSTLLPPVFAGTLTGTHTGTTVYACAQAEWGAPLSSTAIGFTISGCMWNMGTGITDKNGKKISNTATYAPPPPYNQSDPATRAALKPFDQVIYLKGEAKGDFCAKLPNGAAAPGNFGWTSKSNCQVTISAVGTYPGATGNSGAGDCEPLMQGYWQNQTVLDVPVYDPAQVTSSGNNATYKLLGFAPFVITGFSLPGNSGTTTEPDWVQNNNQAPCNGNAWCVSGFFTHELVPTSGTLGGTYMGLAIIKLTG